MLLNIKFIISCLVTKTNRGACVTVRPYSTNNFLILSVTVIIINITNPMFNYRFSKVLKILKCREI